ncbi:MAG: DUF3598 family protein [Synechococcaceae cyanobacterium RL_1_2]|nr:DUF3598 family protein [Synechococcaceae cyanobacterium RL_1_2]
MDRKWANFLKNKGAWRGSFSTINLAGEVLDHTPSLLDLEPFDDDQGMRFRIRRFGATGYDGPPVSDYEQEYRYLGQQIIFFETGAFSKGTLIFAPYGDFGTEFGFVDRDRRLRMVALYDKEAKFDRGVLIREFRDGSGAPERPALTVEQLLGVWEGEACTEYPDFRPPETIKTRLQLTQLDATTLEHQFSFGDRQWSSRSTIHGNTITMEDSPRQITLLPDGGSLNCLSKLEHRQPFFVEVGWLFADGQRQRLIRNYDDRGSWVSSTLIQETKIS